MIVNEETTNSEPSIKIVLLLHTSPSTIPDEGTIVEYRFRGTYISELILDVEFGVGLPNGFIGVFGAAKHLNYLVVRANNKWHWNVLEQ